MKLMKLFIGSLLHTILRELPLTEGAIEVSGSLAYAAQEPWIFSGTVRDNILFGKPYQSDWYDQVIAACALEHDLEQLPYGDKTLVSDRGQTLSGGQKARVSLARAVYVKADIYLIDDALSAVDASVGQHIFYKCIGDMLKNKMRILITHQVQFLKDADYIILMENGQIKSQGTFKEFIKKGINLDELAEIIKPQLISTTNLQETQRDVEQYDEGHLLIESIRNDLDSDLDSSSRSQHISQTSSRKYVNPAVLNIIHEFGDSKSQSRKLVSSSEEKPKTEKNPIENIEKTEMTSKGVSSSEMSQKLKVEGGPPTKITKEEKEAPEETEEKQNSNGVPMSLYWKYYRAGSNCFTFSLIFLLGFLFQLFTSGSDYWLSILTNAEEKNSKGMNMTKMMNHKNPLYYIYNDREVRVWGYATLMCTAILILLVWSYLFYSICTRSSINLHKKLFHGVIRSAMIFFETNPAGRILNRFTKDIGQIDDVIPPISFEVITTLLSAFGSIVTISFVQPFMMIPAAILLIFVLFLRNVYTRTSRSLKRLESISKSPVFSHVATSLYGLTTIRAFQAQENFVRQFDGHQDIHSATWFMCLASSRAFGIWLDWLTSIFISTVIIFFLFSGNTASEMGLAVSTAMTLAGVFQWGAREAAELENAMISTERVFEYAQLKPEAPLKSTADKRPPDDWPREGRIEFRDVGLRYGDHSVLTAINFHADPSEKIGIVGRTGAGKSSLVSVLFRLAEPTGSIWIDDVNITQIGLLELRKKISIIPQEPILFSGTIRNNLDPFNNFSDDQIWNSLEAAHLAKEVQQLPLGLDAPISEGGSNFSVGQRQLFCLTRAILKNNKILVLDEATANVDLETDQLIQQTIQNRFKTSTTLTIAHRLNTVMDSDKMLVLEAGHLMEFAEPFQLIHDNNSLLKNFVDQTGDSTAKDLMKQAKNAHENRLQKNKNVTDLTFR